MTKVPIVIRVLVTESQQITNDGVFKVLQVQEEIVQVDQQVVRQIKVTQLVMKLDSANNEMIAKREITAIELETSDIHKMPQDKDTHKYPDGRKLHVYYKTYLSLINNVAIYIFSRIAVLQHVIVHVFDQFFFFAKLLELC